VLADANKDLVRRFVAALNARDYDAFDVLLDADVVRNSGGRDGSGTLGIDQAKEAFKTAHRSWHHDRQTIIALIAEGDRVVMHAELRAVHAGEWLGIPATNTEVVFNGAFLFRIAGGRIVEILRYADDLSRLRQVGGLKR
jgi:ketosteroid isomerase-like protein